MASRGPAFRIVSINDVYTLENMPRLRNLVRHFTETDPADAMIVVLAGDFVAPSLLSSLDNGRSMIACMNAVGVTHVVLGNHEDDVPTDELVKRLQELRGKCLGTNVHGFDDLPAQDVIEVRGTTRTIKVGLVGVVMDDAVVYRRKPFGGAKLDDPNEAVRREAKRLMDQGCGVVIPITHQTLSADHELAKFPWPVIIGGHEHDIHIEYVGKTWIVKGGSDAVHAAVTDIEWSDDPMAEGVLDSPKVTVKLEDVAKYAEDASVRAMVDAAMRPVHALETATLVTLGPEAALSSVGTRVRQTSMGTLVCSRLRDALDADACLFNGGGIRGSREYRTHLTYGDVKTEVPFDNEVVVVSLPGQVIAEAVASSRAHAPAESPGFLQVDDGMVVDGKDVVVSIAGAPLQPEREYRVALVRNLLTGLDHVTPLIRFGEKHPEKVPPEGSGRDVKEVLVHAFSLALWEQLGGFDAVDANRDGVVSEKELEAAIAKRTHEAPSPIVADLLIHAIDENRDGVLSREEVEAAERSKRGKP